MHFQIYFKHCQYDLTNEISKSFYIRCVREKRLQVIEYFREPVYKWYYNGITGKFKKNKDPQWQIGIDRDVM